MAKTYDWPALVCEYDSGVGTDVIAQRLNSHRGVIARGLKKHGATMRPAGPEGAYEAGRIAGAQLRPVTTEGK